VIEKRTYRQGNQETFGRQLMEPEHARTLFRSIDAERETADERLFEICFSWRTLSFARTDLP